MISLSQRLACSPPASPSTRSAPLVFPAMLGLREGGEATDGHRRPAERDAKLGPGRALASLRALQGLSAALAAAGAGLMEEDAWGHEVSCGAVGAVDVSR